MKVSMSSSPAQSRQVRQRLANPQESLSYELGKAVQELPPLYTRLLAGGISVLVFGTLVWAHFSKIDEVAITNGEVIPSTQVRPVRALNPGSIQAINVKDGDVVKKGQILVLLDPAESESEVKRLQDNARIMQQDIARLEAENRGDRTSAAPLQNQLLVARLNQYETERTGAIAEANRQLAIASEARERLIRFEGNLKNAQISLQKTQEILGKAQEREESLRGLVEQSIVPRLDYNQAQQQVIQASSQVTQAEDQVLSIEKEVDAQRARIRQAEDAYRAAASKANSLTAQRQSEILTNLTRRKEEYTNLSGQLKTAKLQNDRNTVEAPFDGTVYSVKATRGPVQSGEELLSIVPKDEKLVLEVKVLNRDIGFIRKGMRAKVKMATFPYQEFGIIDGEVLQVSPNAIADKDLGPVFPTRVLLKQSTINVKGQSVDITPGMAASAEIVTRKKSVLSFMTEPITRRFNEAFSVR